MLLFSEYPDKSHNFTPYSYHISFLTGLKVFHNTLYLCSECSFVFFLDRLTANEKASISKAVLEIEANAVKINEEAERSGQLIATLKNSRSCC